jgi:nitrate reductase beta subunit
MFQIIDLLSRCIFNDDNEETTGAIAKFIQSKDSPIYEMFFFLQRALPLHEESKKKNHYIFLINKIYQ